MLYLALGAFRAEIPRYALSSRSSAGFVDGHATRTKAIERRALETRDGGYLRFENLI